VNLSERSTEIKGIFYAHCKRIISVPPSFDIYPGEKHPYNGTIIEEGIKFIDGSLLNFFEKIEDGKIGRYSYEYIRPDTGFFFHYENEGIENGIRKPLHHLHVGILKEHANDDLLSQLPSELLEHKGPHFIAPEMSFYNFMGIILVNFFEKHDDCEEMIRNLGL